MEPSYLRQPRNDPAHVPCSHENREILCNPPRALIIDADCQLARQFALQRRPILYVCHESYHRIVPATNGSLLCLSQLSLRG